MGGGGSNDTKGDNLSGGTDKHIRGGEGISGGGGRILPKIN